MKQPVAVVVLLCGFVLLAVGFAWTTLFSAESGWTEAKSKRSVEVKARLAYVGGQIKYKKAPAAQLPQLQSEFDALQKENEELNSEFHSVAEKPGGTAKILRWSGIALAIFGVVGLYAANQSK